METNGMNNEPELEDILLVLICLVALPFVIFYNGVIEFFKLISKLFKKEIKSGQYE